MAKAKQKPARKPRPRQRQLTGLESPSIPELDDLADRYVAVRDQRQALTKDETGKRDLLQLKMKEHGLSVYEFDGKVIEVVADEKVRVRRKKSAEDTDDEADE